VLAGLGLVSVVVMEIRETTVPVGTYVTLILSNENSI
jgi:hypothetical protein